MPRAKGRRSPPPPVEVRIDDLSHDGRGVAHVEGKAFFVHGALPGERVLAQRERRRRHFDEGRVLEILEPSPERVAPRCAHFGLCGGCSLQHLAPTAQIRHKQEILLEALERIGKVTPARILPPLSAGHWGYRRKARLGAKYVQAKGKVLVGFRERGTSFVADLRRCEVLHPLVGEALADLAGLLDGLSIRERVPQVEMSMGDTGCALTFRVLDPPGEADREAIARFGRERGIQCWLQGGGPHSLVCLDPDPGPLEYSLPTLGLHLRFEPQDFTQVNLELNRLMIDQALALLDPQPDEDVLDLFCGIGNFSLPLARKAARVQGVEGDAGLVQRAAANAERNGLHNLDFVTADLYRPLDDAPWLEQEYPKVLLDPPRSGALEVLPRIAALGAGRILYVSCYPATLARDAGVLVYERGYRLIAAGAMDMFPHTAHVESMALFERR